LPALACQLEAGACLIDYCSLELGAWRLLLFHAILSLSSTNPEEVLSSLVAAGVQYKPS